jgi:putative aminopeptidase FrvX
MKVTSPLKNLSQLSYPFKPAKTLLNHEFSSGEIKDTGKHQGEKLGVLGSAVVGIGGGTAILNACSHILPSMLSSLVGPVGFIAGLVFATLEEKKIGIGRKIGGLVGEKAASFASHVKEHFVSHKEGQEKHENISLTLQAPKGKKPFEPLLPGVLHELEKKCLGRIPERTKAVEIGEGLGATAGILAGASLTSVFPMIVGLSSFGPIGAALFGIVGALFGMGIGSVEENALGIGRFLGELSGNAAHFVYPKQYPTKKQEIKPPSNKDEMVGEISPSRLKEIFGKIGKAVLEGLQIVTVPISSFFTDWISLTNRLFEEKPYQCIIFKNYPKPEVNEKRLVENFIHLAGIRGTYQNEENISNEIQHQLKEMGISFEVKPHNQILATIPGTVADAPTVLLAAHMDTCAPTSAEAIRTNGRRIYTDGTHILGADDRAGVAEILEGVRTVLEKNLPHPEIKLLFTTGEEVGLRGASSLKPEEISNRPTLGYVMDSLGIEDLHLSNDNMTLVNPESISYRFSPEDPLVQVALRSMADAGVKPRLLHAPIMIGAGTDANTKALNSGLIRSLAIGAGEHDVHTMLEYVRVKDLAYAAKEIVGFITHACDLQVEGDKILPRAVVPTFGS